MKIDPLGVRLAKTAGFCMGVRRAVDLALDLVRQKKSQALYSYGPLIHNPQTLELLEAQGIRVVHDLDALQGEDALIIVRAHGISPSERQKIADRGFSLLDATCPKVAHVQAIIKKHAAKGYNILIVGDPDHPEVNGLLGYAQGRGRVAKNRREAAALPRLDKLCVVAQTTQDMTEYKQIMDDLKKVHPGAVFFNTICDSTAKRQEEVTALAKEMEVMIIVGGKNSANTKRLAELSRKEGARTFHIETVGELEGEVIEKCKKIGVSAGASTPNWIIDQVMDRVIATRKRGGLVLRSPVQFWVWLVKNDLYAALGAASLSFCAMLLMGARIRVSIMLAASFYVYGMHILNRYLNRRLHGVLASAHRDLFLPGQRYRLFLALTAVATSMVISLFAGAWSFIFLLAITLLGLLYYVPIFPGFFRFRSIRDIPGSKNISMGLAWATVTALLPALGEEGIRPAAVLVPLLFVFYLVSARSVISDIWDIQSDRLKGLETMPVVLGIRAVRRLIFIVSVPVFLMLFFARWAGWVSDFSPYLSVCLFYLWICLRLCDRRLSISSFVMEGLLETSYLLAGLITLAWLWGG